MLYSAIILLVCMPIIATEKTPFLAIQPCNKKFLNQTTPHTFTHIERSLIQEKGRCLYLLSDIQSGQKLAAIRLPFKCTDATFFSYFAVNGTNYYLVLNHLNNQYLVDLKI